MSLLHLTVIGILAAGLTVQAQGPAHVGISAADAVRLRSALEAYDSQNNAAAEPVLRELAKRYPQSFEANEALGGIYAEAGETARALPFLLRAAEASPENAAGHANVGVAYLKLDRPEKAVAELRRASQLDPRNVQSLSALGRALMLTRQPAEAVKAFRAAAALAPQEPSLRYDAAVALADNKQPSEAATELEAIPAAARSDESLALAGDVYEQLGRYKDAVASYQAAAQANPSAANLYSLTTELLRHWTWAEALQVANYGAQKFPDQARFRAAAGIALYGDNKYPEAAAAFAALLAADPGNESYADLLGRSCNAVAEGVETNCNGLGTFAAAHPENARVSVYAAAAILHKPASVEDLQRADQLLQHALVAEPRLAEAYYQLGVLDQQRSDWPASQKALERAVELRPAYPEAHYRLSRAYAHTGQKEAAQREVVLQQKYAQEAKDNLNARMSEVVLFLTRPN